MKVLLNWPCQTSFFGMSMYYAKGIIPLTKIFGKRLHSQEPKGDFAIISHLITLNKMVQLTKYFSTELGSCFYLQVNAFLPLVQTKHTTCRQESSWVAPRLAEEKPYDPLATDDAHRGRVPAPATSRRQGNSTGALCSYQSLEPAAPECQCSCCHCTHADM